MRSLDVDLVILGYLKLWINRKKMLKWLFVDPLPGLHLKYLEEIGLYIFLFMLKKFNWFIFYLIFNRYTEKVDVYSYGVVLWELFNFEVFF